MKTAFANNVIILVNAKNNLEYHSLRLLIISKFQTRDLYQRLTAVNDPIMQYKHHVVQHIASRFRLMKVARGHHPHPHPHHHPNYRHGHSHRRRNEASGVD